jgi:hypothetical protein
MYVLWHRYKKSQLLPKYNFSTQTISGLFACLYYRLPKSASASKNLTLLTQIHLYSQYNHLNFLLYLHSVYGGGACLLRVTAESCATTHLGFNQADLLPQFIQEIETYNRTIGTIRIYAHGIYWLSPKDIVITIVVDRNTGV